MFGTRWMAILFGIAFVAGRLVSRRPSPESPRKVVKISWHWNGLCDDRTWLHYLRAGDYSAWLRDKIKDGELADDVASAEKDEALTPSESRRRIKEAIERRYTNPA